MEGILKGMITGVTAEPLYFLKVMEKGISDGTLNDTWRHVILPEVRYFKGNYLKPVCSRNISFNPICPGGSRGVSLCPTPLVGVLTAVF